MFPWDSIQEMQYLHIEFWKLFSYLEYRWREYLLYPLWLIICQFLERTLRFLLLGTAESLNRSWVTRLSRMCCCSRGCTGEDPCQWALQASAPEGSYVPCTYRIEEVAARCRAKIDLRLLRIASTITWSESFLCCPFSKKASVDSD